MAMHGLPPVNSQIDQNRPTSFSFFNPPKNLDGCLDLVPFFVLPRLKQWPNFAAAPGSCIKKNSDFPMHAQKVTGVQHKPIDWSLWEGSLKYALQRRTSPPKCMCVNTWLRVITC